MALTSDSVLLTIGTGMFVHLLFNRLEPRKTRYYLALLVGIPTMLIIHLSPLFSSVLVAVFCIYPLFLLALACSVILYRLSPVHPLAKFPGPILDRISMIRLFTIAAGGKRHEYFKKLHDTHGPFVRFGPNHISILDAEAIPQILGTQGIPRGELHSMFIPEGGGSVSTECDPKKHAEMRKTWDRGFAPTAVKGYDHFISKRIAQLMDCLGKEVKPVNLTWWISLFQYDVMGDLVFGGGFELMKSGGDPDGYWTIQHQGTAVASLLVHVPWVAPFFRYIPLGERSERFVKFGQDCVKQRLSVGCVTKDLLHYLSGEDKPDAAELTPLKRLLMDGPSAMHASTDTTAGLTTGLLYYILRYPEVYKRLQAEIDSFDVDDYCKLADLPYLNACLQETLRLMPSSPAVLQRTSPKDTVICGHFIPAGTHILMPPYPFHRRPQYFYPHPEDFWPDRWLIAADSEKEAPPDFVHVKSAFIPFGLGPHACPGRPLASREARAVVTKMMQSFEMRFADGYDPERYPRELCDEIAWAPGELPVVLTPRRV